ncbi:MAG: O-antigen ligase family protein [Saprospiraceae bacterium]
MSMQIRKPQSLRSESLNNGLQTPSVLIEFGYFLILIYANLGAAFGVAISLVGPAALGGLAVICLLHFGTYSWEAFKPIRYPLGCAISILLVQVLLFQESLLHPWNRYFIAWILALLVVQSIALRQGFLHRFAILAFLIGCGTLPFLKIYGSADEMLRFGGNEDTALGNPNFFGMWFGFCSIYFIVTGLEAKNYIIRTVSWSAGVFCLYLMAITVSRSPLIGVVIALVFAFQKVLKRSFLPVLGLLLVGWVVYVSGIFDELIRYYIHRGGEDTGRSRLWMWAFSGILDSWGMGVGLSNSFVSLHGDSLYKVGPHNSLLFVWLSSGLIPLAFYLAYLGKAVRGAFRAKNQKTSYSPYLLPLVSFAMLELMVLDGVFMSAWHLVVFSLAIGTVSDSRGHRSTLLDKIPRKNMQKWLDKRSSNSFSKTFIQKNPR